jgi:hypothetical protein
MSEILDISCDEAGHTGPDLLNKDQRHFAFASVAITDAEAQEIVRKTRVDNRVQMPELKAANLLTSERGRKMVRDLLAAIDGRFAITVHNKLYALCTWFFEYIYEPVYQNDPRLLYEKNFHRFIATYAWLWLYENESQAALAVEQFQRYMRSRNPDDAPFLFNNPRPPLSRDGSEHPFESVLRFAYGYRDIIVADNAQLDAQLPHSARWVLDLSTPSLWSHLNHWGPSGKLLSVQCDASKPLQSNIQNFTGDPHDPGIKRARAVHDHRGPLGWRLLQPVAFVDSRAHSAVQLADVIAGTAVAVFSSSTLADFQAARESIGRHGLADSLLPDLDIINPATRMAAVNALIAYDLAQRAERRADPHKNLKLMYRLAEVAWARGDYSLTGT